MQRVGQKVSLSACSFVGELAGIGATALRLSRDGSASRAHDRDAAAEDFLRRLLPLSLESRIMWAAWFLGVNRVRFDPAHCPSWDHLFDEAVQGRILSGRGRITDQTEFARAVWMNKQLTPQRHNQEELADAEVMLLVPPAKMKRPELAAALNEHGVRGTSWHGAAGCFVPMRRRAATLFKLAWT